VFLIKRQTIGTNSGSQSIEQFTGVVSLEAAKQKPKWDRELAEEEIKKLLRNKFNIPSFKSWQIPPILATLKGESIFVIAPTGVGKSIVPQITIMASQSEGKILLAILPLRSLIDQQVEMLQELGIPAISYTSSSNRQQKKFLQDEILSGTVRAVYCTPEAVGYYFWYS
jgi:superfamily II DNA helicase RecQ